MTILNSRAAEAASVLLAARHQDMQLPTLPDYLHPADLAEAYAIQDETISLIGAVGGWKVGAKPDSEPRCSALPASAFQRAGALLTERLTWPAGGFQAEVELGVVFGSSLPPRARPYSTCEVEDAIDGVVLAVELISSRFMDRKSLSPLMAIADLQSNAAVVHGAPIRDWRSLDLSVIPVALSVSGASLPEASKREEWQTTVTTLTWLANHAASRGHGLLEGNLVITGARIGPVSLVSEDVLVASAPGFQDITIAFRP